MIKEFVPIYLLTTEHPTKEDKLQAVVKALIFNSCNDRTKIKEVHFIKGETAKINKIKITSLAQQAKKLLLELEELSTGKLTSTPYWKLHCQICCFQAVCRKELREKDDLSLLTGLSAKEIINKKTKVFFQ
jgi:predicted RecB family nuclease